MKSKTQRQSLQNEYNQHRIYGYTEKKPPEIISTRVRKKTHTKNQVK